MVSLPEAFRSLRRNFSLASDEQEARQLLGRVEHIRKLQQEALEKARKDPSGEGGRITLLDYYKAANAIIMEENATAGVTSEQRLTLSQMFDFSDMKLEGIEFRKEHLDFSPTGREALYKAHNFTPGEWDAVERGLAFNRAELTNVTFIPATALDALNVDRHSLVRLENATFDGMKHGEVLTIEASSDGKPHLGIHFRNIQGGTLALGEGARVENVHAQGAVMHIAMGERSQLIHLHTDNATRIISIAAAPGALIEGARLTGTTIAPGSSLEGTTWRNVALHKVNLKDVDFSRAELHGVTIDGQPATFATLQAAGVAEGQLPASIDGSQRAPITPPTPQGMAMALARGLLASGACVTGDAPDGTNPNTALPVTAEALACKKIDNEAFAASAAALAALGIHT